jgi:hypothetical protein
MFIRPGVVNSSFFGVSSKFNTFDVADIREEVAPSVHGFIFETFIKLDN